MFRSFLKDEISRKKLSERKVAREIGITPRELRGVLRNEPVREDAVQAVCQWLGIPGSALLTSEHEPAYDDIENYLIKIPDILRILKLAASDMRVGAMAEDDFKHIVEFAVLRAKQRL